MEVLCLNLDAPLMSFGGVLVDARGETQDFPALSMLTGLLGNALGYRHGEAERLERLQERLRYAVREDRRGRRLRDFQTLDLGQDFLLQSWTTRGAPEGRSGGTARTGTHIRERWYLAGALYLVVLHLEPADETPTLEDLEEALRRPARPLFLGRKSCLPARPLVGPGPARMEAGSLRDALGLVPPVRGWADVAPTARDSAAADSAGATDNEFLDFAASLLDEDDTTSTRSEATFRIWWPAQGGEPSPGATPLELRDRRDWRNQIHVGRRVLWQGEVELTPPAGQEGASS